jgi:hypothetical protein
MFHVLTVFFSPTSAFLTFIGTWFRLGTGRTISAPMDVRYLYGKDGRWICRANFRPLLCIAKTSSACEMNALREGRVTSYMDDHRSRIRRAGGLSQTAVSNARRAACPPSRTRASDTALKGSHYSAALCAHRTKGLATKAFRA